MNINDVFPTLSTKDSQDQSSKTFHSKNLKQLQTSVSWAYDSLLRTTDP